MAQAEVGNQTRSVVLPWQDTDDEIITNMAIGRLRDSLLMWLKTGRGVHAETLLVAIGALAGFAAQHAVFVRVENRDIPLPAGRLAMWRRPQPVSAHQGIARDRHHEIRRALLFR